jgi:hypothetical protein
MKTSHTHTLCFLLFFTESEKDLLDQTDSNPEKYFKKRQTKSELVFSYLKLCSFPNFRFHACLLSEKQTPKKEKSKKALTLPQTLISAKGEFSFSKQDVSSILSLQTSIFHICFQSGKCLKTLSPCRLPHDFFWVTVNWFQT